MNGPILTNLMGQSYTEEGKFSPQKFAELIVRECGQVYIQNQQDGVMTLTEDLLYHFGIKK